MLSCRSDVISAKRSWMTVPVTLIFLPKTFMACPTMGMTTNVSRLSFQSR